MMKFWRVIVLIIMILQFNSIVLGETSIDLKIKSILKQTVGNISNFKGAVVVDISSGDLIGYYIVDTNLASNREMIAATVTNIVRNVKISSEKLDLEPLWFGIGLDGGNKLLIGYIHSDNFLGVLYGKHSPIGAIKYQMKKAMQKLKSIL